MCRRLAALEVLACYFDNGFINQHRNALLNSSLWAVLADVVFKASEQKLKPSSGGHSAFGSCVASSDYLAQ